MIQYASGYYILYMLYPKNLNLPYDKMNHTSEIHYYLLPNPFNMLMHLIA